MHHSSSNASRMSWRMSSACASNVAMTVLTAAGSLQAPRHLLQCLWQMASRVLRAARLSTCPWSKLMDMSCQKSEVSIVI
jgi:hypothetical protein